MHRLHCNVPIGHLLCVKRGCGQGVGLVWYVIALCTSFRPFVLVTSISGFLSSKLRILEAEILALAASGAKELARPRKTAVKTTAANTLVEGEYSQSLFSPFTISTHTNQPLTLSHANPSNPRLTHPHMQIRSVNVITETDWKMSSYWLRPSTTRKAPKL